MAGTTQNTTTYTFCIPISMATQINVIADCEDTAFAKMDEMDKSGMLRMIVQSHIENGLLDFSIENYELEEIKPCNTNCQTDICRRPA